MATDSQPPWQTVEKKQYKLRCQYDSTSHWNFIMFCITSQVKEPTRCHYYVRSSLKCVVRLISTSNLGWKARQRLRQLRMQGPQQHRLNLLVWLSLDLDSWHAMQLVFQLSLPTLLVISPCTHSHDHTALNTKQANLCRMSAAMLDLFLCPPALTPRVTSATAGFFASRACR